ncbi:MAG: hypothetical protein WDO14_02860 [Bacteroidota bacterium]
MVEVFKTNVTGIRHARVLADAIRYHFEDYKVNFDLGDCDHILRIESTQTIAIDALIIFLNNLGVEVELLADEMPLIII